MSDSRSAYDHRKELRQGHPRGKVAKQVEPDRAGPRGQAQSASAQWPCGSHTDHATERNFTVPTADELYPSKWLKASDVEPPVIVTVEKCRLEDVGQAGKVERKLVVHFVGSTKPHICNRTNFNTLAALTGYENSDDWGGARVELYAVDTVGPNGPTRGIRIRPPRPSRAKETFQANPNGVAPHLPPDAVAEKEVGF